MYFLAVVSFCLVGSSLADPVKDYYFEDDGRIVGGIPADIEDFPYQISLQYRGRHSCGGAILGPKTIVTAAHCTNGANATFLSIRAGSNSYKEGGEVIQVKEIVQHPFYDNYNIDYDISLLILEEELKFNKKIQPVEICENEIGPNHFVVVTGWGTLKESGKLPDVLQQVFVPLLPENDCKKFYGEKKITERMICAGYTEGGHDSCQGDSGGPLVYKDKLIGVVSWGIGCARPNYPGVYTSVHKVHAYLKPYV